MKNLFKEHRMHCSRGLNDEQGRAKCQYIKDEVLYTCSAFVCISGRHPQKDKQYEEEWHCVDTWIPILLTENARTNRGQTEAIETFRNKMVEANERTLNLLGDPDAGALPRK